MVVDEANGLGLRSSSSSIRRSRGSTLIHEKDERGEDEQDEDARIDGPGRTGAGGEGASSGGVGW
jgi:hypothetical protein